MNRKMKKLWFIVVGGLALLVFLVLMFARAMKADEKRQFEEKYNLTQYDTDPYEGRVEYDTQGAVPEAGIKSAGTEGADWGEGVGIYSTYTDENGKVLWEGISRDAYDKMTEDEKRSVNETYARVEDQILGGAGSVDLTEDTAIDSLLYNGSAYENIASLCTDYNEGIPFSYNGRSYAIGFNLQKDGFDNSVYPIGSGYGLDGPGYMIWLFRNALGHTPRELKGEFSYKNLEQDKISYKELQVGDICSTGETDTDVEYGVVAGFSDGVPVVSVCNNDASVLFPYGCNHLVYIKGAKDEALGAFAPVDFKVYYRLEDMANEK